MIDFQPTIVSKRNKTQKAFMTCNQTLFSDIQQQLKWAWEDRHIESESGFLNGMTIEMCQMEEVKNWFNLVDPEIMGELKMLWNNAPFGGSFSDFCSDIKNGKWSI